MNSAIVDGFKLMLLGMGMVFLFLMAMITFITITSIILKFIQSRMPVVAHSGGVVKHSAEKNLMHDKDFVAVLSEAITTYKADKQK
jgi:sodium pump decarboxylase gamma subunit